MNTSLLLLLAIVFALNAYATVLSVRSSRYEARQKWFQFGLVWLLPPLGALLVIYLTRESRPARRASGYSANYGGDGVDFSLGSFSSGDCSAGDSGGCDGGGGDGGGGGD